MHLKEIVESQTALGGKVTIGLIMSSHVRSRQLFDELWLELFSFEKAASRFLENSELTRLNRYGAIYSISPQFRSALLSALRSTALSGGFFNPFVLPAVQKTGYLHSTIDPDKTVVADVRKRRIAEARELEVGDTWAKIPHGTAIDLGGCGKGHIVDVLAAKAQNNDAVCGGWIEASGDIFAWGHDDKYEPITIAVQSITSVVEELLIVIPENGLGVATSGTFARPNLSYAKDSHHIIDPRTNQPAVSDVRLATVCAASGLEADVLASCAIIAGLDDAPNYLSDHGATDWVLQSSKQVQNKSVVAFAGPNILQKSREILHA